MTKKIYILIVASFLVVVFTAGCADNNKDTPLSEEPINAGKLLEKSIEVLIAPSFEFDYVSTFSDVGYASVEKDGKWGLVNAEGRLVLPTVYDYTFGDMFEGFFDDLAIVVQSGKYGYVNTEGKVAVPLEYDYGRDFKNGFADVSKNGKYGIIDTSGATAVPFEYDSLTVLPTNLAIAVKDNKFGVIDMTGNEVIPMIYEDINALPFDFNYDSHFFEFRQNGKGALADLAGNLLTDFVYEYIDFFSQGLAAVRKETGKWGYIDSKGTEVISAIYDQAFHFNHGLAGVTKDGIDEFIDLTGTTAFESNAVGFYDSYYLSQINGDNGKWGVIDRTGKLVVPIEYDDVVIFEDVYIWVSDRMNQLSGYYDKDGKVIVPFRDSSGYGSVPAEGLIGLKNCNKWGYIDYADKVVIDFEYDAVGHFNSGFAPVQKNGMWGYINKFGQISIALDYDEAHSFNGGLAWFQKEGRWGIMQIIQPQ
jgi:hypothetical protein